MRRSIALDEACVATGPRTIVLKRLNHIGSRILEIHIPEIAPLRHQLVFAGDAVHEYIEAATLAFHSLEEGLHLLLHCVIDAQCDGGASGNPLTQMVKLALKGLALNMAAELLPHSVAAVAVTPGFL